jgi:hypothetical protein
MSVYHACASANKCKGLKEGIHGYHACAKKQNCKKDDRAKVAAVVNKIKTSKAKEVLKKVVKKKVEKIRTPKEDPAVSFMKKQKVRMEAERRAKREKEAVQFVKRFLNKLIKKNLNDVETKNEIQLKLIDLKKKESENFFKINELNKV